jgi:hypothetical protein
MKRRRSLSMDSFSDFKLFTEEAPIMKVDFSKFNLILRIQRKKVMEKE